MKRIVNEENDWNHVAGDAAESPVVCVSRDEVGQR